MSEFVLCRGEMQVGGTLNVLTRFGGGTGTLRDKGDVVAGFGFDLGKVAEEEKPIHISGVGVFDAGEGGGFVEKGHGFGGRGREGELPHEFGHTHSLGERGG